MIPAYGSVNHQDPTSSPPERRLSHILRNPDLDLLTGLVHIPCAQRSGCAVNKLMSARSDGDKFESGGQASRPEPLLGPSRRDNAGDSRRQVNASVRRPYERRHGDHCLQV